MEATEEDARAYCLEQFPAFFSAMMAAFPSAVTDFLDERQEDFAEFVFARMY